MLSLSMNASSSRSATVLVVDDEPLLLLEAMDLARDAGLDVYGAMTADEALWNLEANSDIGILFVDICIPGSMNGLALAHVVQKVWPTMSLILTSSLDRVAAADLPSGSLFFSQPYRPSLVTTALRELAAKQAKLR